MQEHPLVAFGDIENLTYLTTTQSIDVAQRYDLALARRELLERHLDAIRERLRGEAILAVLDPMLRRGHPRTGGVEAGAIHSRRGIADRDAPMLAHAGAPRPVDEDVKQPRPERRAPSEPVDSAHDAQPCVLHDLLGDRRAGHERASHAQHRGMVTGHKRHERLLITRAQPRDEL